MLTGMNAKVNPMAMQKILQEFGQHSYLNPKPQTPLTPKPYTLNPKPPMQEILQEFGQHLYLALSHALLGAL
jgi:hypothetical protein